MENVPGNADFRHHCSFQEMLYVYLVVWRWLNYHFVLHVCKKKKHWLNGKQRASHLG